MPTKDDIAYCLLLSHTVNNENLYFLYETEHVYFFFELVNLNVFTLVGFVNFNIIMASIFPAGLRNGVKGLDANRYATKKTVAQGMLDIALLTSNASQLKYVLQVGPKHEFYMLLLVLISISIILQLLVGLLFVAIGGLDINHEADQPSAVILNDVIVIFIFVISVTNIVISAFGIEYSNSPLVLERLSYINAEYLRKANTTAS
ncbi:ninjurin-2 isoform X1 [Maniola jurtina]|uniref:ninjurin-2 isoform X1 n=1 Tax=Maniola jurtina TaxID=191418 RepID=UPI001E68F7E2|nr:ninjurin-2 isoform X1 [Maniola jurtina]